VCFAYAVNADADIVVTDINDVLKPKLVYAQNALQARMMVDQQMVDAGLVPVAADQPAFAMIPYIGVLLTEKKWARAWLQQL